MFNENGPYLCVMPRPPKICTESLVVSCAHLQESDLAGEAGNLFLVRLDYIK